MAANHLEQLVAEWCEHKGYYVRRNVKAGNRPRGGYECELDIVAFHPLKKHLIHIEPSLTTRSWEERKRRYQKKFEAGKRYIPTLFSGLDIPMEIDQVALFLSGSGATHETLAGGRVLFVSELLQEIFADLKSQSIHTSMIDEQKPLLRTLQFVAEYRKSILNALNEGEKLNRLLR
jgi:hypothetical protein